MKRLAAEEKLTLPAELVIKNVDEQLVKSEILLTIYEGKFHQVKRMMEAVGKKVVYLKRLSMGNLQLPDDLEKGECRSLTEEEIQQIAYYRAAPGNIVSLEGHLLPYDQVQETIYIPCNVSDGMKFYELEGQLQSILPEYQIYFVWSGLFDAFSDAIKYGAKFSMVVIDDVGNFATYGVVFTTLPIVETALCTIVVTPSPNTDAIF